MAKLTSHQINGAKGGLKVKRKYGVEYLRNIASNGGNAVVDKYGPKYMSLIGSLGANVVNENLSLTAENRIRKEANRIIDRNS